MAATEPVPPASAETVKPSVVENFEKLAKVEKPDDEKYKKDLADAEKQLAIVSEKLVHKFCDSKHLFLERSSNKT